jgi:beta-lactam-binding protein with PASTA domain
MTGQDGTDEHETQQPANDGWQQVEGGFVVPFEGGGEPDSEAAPTPAEPPAETEERGHPIRTAILAVLGVLVIVGVAMGVWFWATVTSPVVVPQLVGLAPSAAVAALDAAHLSDGNGNYLATWVLPSGVVSTQSPPPGARVAQGTPVNVQVVTVPMSVAVPNLVTADVDSAQTTLGYYLLKPTLLYAYSVDVETGRVIEQLPRAGDTATTGGSEVLVISLGPGTGGKTVPSLVGMSVGSANSVIASATLYPMLRAVVATGVADGTVVDQAPSGGSLVPVASDVTLSIATPAPKP